MSRENVEIVRGLGAHLNGARSLRMVVDQRREQIIRRTDGMQVAGEVEVDVLHRHDLRIAAAGCAALHAEAGAERGLAQAQHRLLADVVERVGEADRGRGLALACRRRRDRLTRISLPFGRSAAT